MKLLMIEDNKSVSEMMAMFLRRKSGMPILLMMAMKLSKCSMKMSMAGIW